MMEERIGDENLAIDFAKMRSRVMMAAAKATTWVGIDKIVGDGGIGWTQPASAR